MSITINAPRVFSKEDRFNNLYTRNKLTVDGTIDPINIDLTETSSVVNPSPHHGKIWIQNSSPQILNFTRSDGLIIPLTSSSGGAIAGPGVSTVNAIAKWNNTLGTLLANSGVFIDGSNRLGVNTTVSNSQISINSATGQTLRLIFNNSLGTETNFSDLNITSTGILNLLPSSSSTAINNIGTAPLPTSDDLVLHPSAPNAETGITMFSSNTGTRFCHIRAGDSISGNNNFDIRFDNATNTYVLLRGGNIICTLTDAATSAWSVLQRFSSGISLSADSDILSRYKTETNTTDVKATVGGATLFTAVPFRAARIGDSIVIDFPTRFTSPAFAAGGMEISTAFSTDFRPLTDTRVKIVRVKNGASLQSGIASLTTAGILSFLATVAGGAFAGTAGSGFEASSMDFNR